MRQNIYQTWSNQKYILDAIASVPACYALRKLKKSYTGNLIRVQRTSDNAIASIGSDRRGNLNTQQLLSFAGVGGANILTWYDQSGFGRDLTPFATPPSIVIAGGLIIKNNRPAIYFNQSPLLSQNFTGYPTGCTFIGVASILAPVGGGSESAGLFSKGNNNYPSPIDTYTSTYYVGAINNASPRTLTIPIAPAAGHAIWSFVASPSTIQAYYNGANNLVNPNPIGQYADEGRRLGIGSRDDLYTKLNGYVSELITLNNTMTIDRQNIERNMSSYYTISI